ncbi:MAG: PEP-CTERM sorting domain-containing protein [Candidatus Korobacteraceae bacterium]|jgi:hypothetical protein
MRKLMILAVFVCGSVYAFADPTEFTFIGWNDGNWQNGYPYYIEASNGSPTILNVMCDDYAHGGMPGDQWEANITDLGTGNIQLTRFNTTPGENALYPLKLYDESGWLLLQTLVEPTSQWVFMNSAVWNIFDPSAPCNTNCEAWISAAMNGVKGLPQNYFDDVYIITPVNQHNPDPHSMQEFMYLGEGGSNNGQDQQTTPEPGTLVLMGTGVLALFGRRKFLN